MGNYFPGHWTPTILGRGKQSAWTRRFTDRYAFSLLPKILIYWSLHLPHYYVLPLEPSESALCSLHWLPRAKARTCRCVERNLQNMWCWRTSTISERRKLQPKTSFPIFVSILFLLEGDSAKLPGPLELNICLFQNTGYPWQAPEFVSMYFDHVGNYQSKVSVSVF